MSEPIQPPRPGPSRTVLFIVIGVALTLMLLFVSSIFLFLHYRHSLTRPAGAPARINVTADLSTPADYSLSNSVTVFLGEDESGQGLTASQNVGDGRTTIESIEGVAARAQRLTNNRTTLTFDFRLDPTFK